MGSREIGVICSRIPAILVVSVLVAVGWPVSAATTERFLPTTIHYPGSTSTTARGINNVGDIIGTYTCSAPCLNPLTGETSPAGTSGFLFREGGYTRIKLDDLPGATNIVPRGISDQGMIVGHFVAGGLTHGFEYLDGRANKINVPSELFDNPSSTLPHTLVVGISPQGDLVGCFHEGTDTMMTMHGWFRRNGEFIALMTPHGSGDTTSRDPDTMSNGVSPTGRIVGAYFSSGVSYVADQNGIVETFTFDGNLFTQAWGVNPRGDVVGVYGENQAETMGFAVRPRGFLRTKHGNFRSLEVQDANSTQVFGINAAGDIVGSYTVGTVTRGFVYRVSRAGQ